MEKKTHKHQKVSRIFLWIGRGLGVIPILLFFIVFIPGLVTTYPKRHDTLGFYSLLPMVVFIGIGCIGYIISWGRKKGWEKPGYLIIISATLLMGLYLPIRLLILEGRLGDFGSAGIYLIIWGLPALFITLSSKLSAKDP
jgi:hypothetical protein